jgi:hypothetical protein
LVDASGSSSTNQTKRGCCVTGFADHERDRLLAFDVVVDRHHDGLRNIGVGA